MLKMEIIEPEMLEMKIAGQTPSTIGGTTNYNELSGKPKINGVELKGNKTLDELNIAPKDYTQDKIEEVESIAKGANQALSFANYSSMASVFNALGNDIYNKGQNVMIVTLEVPDLWISDIAEENIEYAYTNDDDLTNLLKEQGYIQVGYYKLSQLETQKVDLTNYVKNTDFATDNKAGIIKTNASMGTRMLSGGILGTYSANETVIDGKTNNYRPIVPANLDYAVGSVKASETQSGSAKMWTSTNEDGEIGLNISTEV